jgi:hypothetical protein
VLFTGSIIRRNGGSSPSWGSPIPGLASGERRHRREGQRHLGEEWQARPRKRLVRSREDEGQHLQDAGAKDSQSAAEIGDQKKNDLYSGTFGIGHQHRLCRKRCRKGLLQGCDLGQFKGRDIIAVRMQGQIIVTGAGTPPTDERLKLG